eukprot:COSAG01_NODE_75489_length_195_cov_133.427083_1_plen_51_part_01
MSCSLLLGATRPDQSLSVEEEEEEEEEEDMSAAAHDSALRAYLRAYLSLPT